MCVPPKVHKSVSNIEQSFVLSMESSEQQKERQEEQGEEQRKEQHEEQQEEQRPVSLFVDNLPPLLHWKGLWQIFGRYCDVMNAFIANKRSKRGSRFGFVKVSNKKDAAMAIERLNGRNVYGSRISVVTTKFKNIPIAGECVMKDKGEVRTSNKQVQKGPSKETIWERDESIKNEIKGRKRIMAHVETEELWKMRRCLVGRMLSVCSTRSIELRLQAWGLGEIKVHRLGGKTFLISIDDEDLFFMLEDLQWSYLKEIFLDVKPWYESLVQKERATGWNCLVFQLIAGTTLL
ncbi:hypothetical protein V6N13_014299 [Hibiscus sabdariffa]